MTSSYTWGNWSLPSSLFVGVFVFLIQMASFICRVLLFGSFSMIIAPSQSMMWFSVIAWSVTVTVSADLLLLVYFSLFVLSASFLCSSSLVFSCLPVSPIHSAPQFLHGIWYNSSPCSTSSTLSFGCTSTRLRVVGGRMAVATLYFFITRWTHSKTPSTHGITTWLL